MLKIHYDTLTSVLGNLAFYWTSQGLCRLELRPNLPISKASLSQFFSNAELEKSSLPETWRQQIEQYFTGKLRQWQIPLDLRGTDFQLQVWQQLQTIPYAQTISYRKLAELCGRPQAFRAVGAANGQNPVPIIVPCHRVVNADGKLGGYSGGLDIKEKLLSLEKSATEP